MGVNFKRQQKHPLKDRIDLRESNDRFQIDRKVVLKSILQTAKDGVKFRCRGRIAGNRRERGC